jgi:mannose-6-phosphate isomerase class I
MGTHPNFPSSLYDRPELLSAHLADHPEMLGDVADTERFPVPIDGDTVGHVPFLFKVLSCKQGEWGLHERGRVVGQEWEWD